jgi:hypothetical protein
MQPIATARAVTPVTCPISPSTRPSVARVLRQIAVRGLFANVVLLVVAMAPGGVDGNAGRAAGALVAPVVVGNGLDGLCRRLCHACLRCLPKGTTRVVTVSFRRNTSLPARDDAPPCVRSWRWIPGPPLATSRGKMTRRANQIACTKPVQPLFEKYSAFAVGQISSISSPRPFPARGADRASSRTREGMRWTRQRRRAWGIAGRVYPVSEAPARKTNGVEAYGKTVWSWHPLLMSSCRWR